MMKLSSSTSKFNHTKNEDRVAPHYENKPNVTSRKHIPTIEILQQPFAFVFGLLISRVGGDDISIRGAHANLGKRRLRLSRVYHRSQGDKVRAAYLIVEFRGACTQTWQRNRIFRPGTHELFNLANLARFFPFRRFYPRTISISWAAFGNGRFNKCNAG